ncbi:hypothetical protein FOA52_002371 [Chlamydomonas sp. UWO 241]|nr:hypothetical protein FOA52_002371 [Chlamydomonas sp. UWO 241]
MHSKSIGSFASEEDAARGYEDAAGQAHGPGKPGALLGGTADDAAQHRIAVAAADAEPGAGASLSCGSEDGSVGLFYAATLREGYDAYCVALRACAAGRAGGSGGRKDRAWGSTAATSSPSVPTFEAYSRGVLAEMDAREAALHSEGARVRAAARRGATGEMPAARTLMAQWEESLTDAIKYDMKKLAGLLMSQTESDAATAAARARLGAAAGTGAKAATRQQLAEAAAAGASEQQALTHESLAQHRAQYHSLLFSLPPAVLAEITAQVAASTVLSVGNGGRVKFTRCAATVGDAVRDRLRHNELCSRVVEETEKRDAATKDRQKHKTKLSKERHKKEAGADESAVPEEVRYAALLQSAANDHQTATRCLKQLRELAAMVVPTSGRKGGRENLQKSVDRLLDLQGWTNADSVRIGGELLHALLRTATVTLPGTRAASTPTVPAPAAPHAPGAGAPHALAAGAAPHAPQAQQAVPGAAEGAGGVVVWPAQSDLDQTWRDAEREITPFVPRGTPASPWAGGGPADVRQQHALSSPQALPERLEQQQQHALSSPQPPPEQQQAERLPQLREVPAFVHAISPLQDVGMATSEESDNPWKGQIRAIGTLSLVDAAMSQLLSGSAKFYSGGQKLMPMLVPPRPWTHYRRGGHLTQSHDIARVPRKHAHRLRTAHENGELQRVYDALNILGEVPWRINTGILNVLEELGAASGATSTLGTSPQLPNVLAGFRAAVTGEGVPKRPTARTAAAAAAAKAETKAASAASMQVPGRGATTPAAAPASAASPTALRSAAAAARAAAATAARASEMSAVAQGVGLPDAIHPVPPLSHFAPRPGAQLRASREGLGGGQLLVSSGTPMRGERTFSMARRAEAHRAHMEALSIKTFFLYRVQLARELSSAPQFFFPHNLDFRGRAYPMHPYLHHMGDDVTRGLLTFARAKPLGADGLRWLKIHVANMWGHGEDKKPLAERAAFAEANLEAIAESVASPLAGKRWWAEAEKPWQLLAAIRELSSALSHPDGPEAFPSTLPVHQDGSCNGLQHYSALARDTTCAAAVNMLPADRPADVYSAVAAAVEARAKRDAAAGRSEATKLLERNGGVVDRKLVKQTVMTTVYGVTEIGARLQISHRLSERGWTNEAEVYQVSRYLAVSTFACLSEVFNNANAVKLWLRESAMRVAATGQEVAWVNPMGLPVSQPYMQLPRMVIRTSLQQAVILAPDHGPAAPATPAAGARAPSSYGARGLQAGGSDVAAAGAPSWASAPGVPMGNARAPGAVRAPGAPSHGTAGAAEADADFARVDKRAQTTAFPPNYIHGLDASHMMMTALACDRAGITFAGVHDSFWTHAGDVDAMGVLLRKEFVTLHNRPLLRELQAHLQAQLDVAAIAAKELAGAKKAAGEKRPAREKIAIVKDLPPIPATGDLNLTDIERSVYFFN